MIAIKIRITAAITPTTTKFTPFSSPLSAVSEGSPLSLSVVWVSPVSVASVDSVDASVSGSVRPPVPSQSAFHAENHHRPCQAPGFCTLSR